MAVGLRERKRRAAMRSIQEAALDLFDERGFAHVSVEEIATAAEVSPSSVYRYFGTKEGIILADEFDALTDEELAEVLDPDDIVGAVRAVVARFETPAGSSANESVAQRRARYFFDEPSVRRASYETLANAAARIAPLLAAAGKLTPGEAYVAASTVVFGYFAALEQRHRQPAENPIGDTLGHALDVLKRL